MEVQCSLGASRDGVARQTHGAGPGGVGDPLGLVEESSSHQYEECPVGRGKNVIT